MMSEGRRLRIAIAEDEPDCRTALVRLLEGLGHDVVCAAAHGADLIEFCQHTTVDLVIVDLDMPVVDGLEAAEHIAERSLPVILLSGHPDVEHVDSAKEPISARLLKPASVEKLQAAIEHALKAR